MINKLDILFGIVFLLIMIGSVNAQYDWATYGNTYTPIANAQFTGATSRFDLGMSQINTTSGISYIGSSYTQEPYQAIAKDINEKGYIIIPVGNYIRIYDHNLNLLNEFFTGQNIAQLDVLDFFNTGNPVDIAGVFNYNSSINSFRIYSFNPNSPYNATKTFEYNFTLSYANLTRYTGLRHSGNKVYFIQNDWTGSTFNLTFNSMNSSGDTSVFITTSGNTYLEPLSWTDVNNDGQNEFLGVSTNNIILFNSAGTILFYPTVPNIYDAKLYHPENSNIWKVATLSVASSGSVYKLNITSFRPDGSVYLSKNIFSFSSGGIVLSGGFMNSRIAIADYDGDGFDDIFVAGIDNTLAGSSQSTQLSFSVLKGNDGSILDNKNISQQYNWGATGSFRNYPSLTLAKLNNTNYDMIFTTPRGLILFFDPYTNKFIYNSTISGSDFLYSCVPSDINVDGFQEVICSGDGYTSIFSGAGINNNAVINSVAYDPSTLISVGQNVNAIISATDPENDLPLSYIHKCSDSESYSAESFSSTAICNYVSVGIYNLTVAVRDPYHSTYNYFSQLITVTSTGFICNNNGICEVGLGETTFNCPNDCFSNTTTTVSSDTGGSSIPVDIVNVNNVNQGLLPEIYYGTLGFLSNTIQPIIILVFFIFFILIILAIAFIIRNIGKKVGDLGK